MYVEKDAEISQFLGGRPPLIFRLRGTRPPVPPLSMPMQVGRNQRRKMTALSKENNFSSCQKYLCIPTYWVSGKRHVQTKNVMNIGLSKCLVLTGQRSKANRSIPTTYPFPSRPTLTESFPHSYQNYRRPFTSNSTTRLRQTLTLHHWYQRRTEATRPQSTVADYPHRPTDRRG